MTPRTALLVLLLAACGDDPPQTPFVCAPPDVPPALRIDGYVVRRLDELTLASSEGRLVAWVFHYADPEGTLLHEREGELFPVIWSDDGTMAHSPLERAASLSLPDDPTDSLVTRVTGEAFDAFIGVKSGGASLSLGAASFPHGLCVLGSERDDWLELRVDGELAVVAGGGQDTLLARGDRVTVDGGDGHDTIELAAPGAGHVIHGGPGRDRIVSLASDAALFGDADEGCVLSAPGDRRESTSPGQDDAATYRWCGPLALPADADAWEPLATTIEDLVMDEIDAARASGLDCPDGPLGPAPLGPRAGPDYAKLRWAARMHMRDMGGFPPPTSPRFAGDALVPWSIGSYPALHESYDGDDYFQRAMRAGVALGPPTTEVHENGTRCVNSQPGCSGSAAEIAHAIFEKWHHSEGHCGALVGFADAPGVVYAVGVFVQQLAVDGSALEPPHVNAVLMITDHRAEP